MRLLAAAFLCVAVLSVMPGGSRALPITRIPEPPGIGSDLPVLSPDRVEWGPESRYPQFEPLTELQQRKLAQWGIDSEAVEGRQGEAAATAAQIKAVEAELSVPGWETGLSAGAGRLILRLSPPGTPVRVVVHLRGGWLYEVAQQPDTGGWSARQLIDFRPSMVDTIDLTGEGRPEIVAGWLYGSGAHLALVILMWDEQRVWELFRSAGAMEPGQYGFFDAEGDGLRELYIDTAAGHGLFMPGIHGPYLRDRLVYRYDGRRYVLHKRYRFATPFYHLNRYLYFARRGQWRRAAEHAEPGAQIDPQLAAWLGEGGLTGGDDMAFINGVTLFHKEARAFRADFGPTGRLLRLPSQSMPPGSAGKVKVNVVPCPSVEATCMVPPIRSTSCRAMASPRPVPAPCFGVRAASTL